jgi:ribosomal protein L30E
MDDSIEKLKKEYMDIEIPVELDLVVKKSLREGKRIMTRKKYIRRALVSAASLALVTSALTVGLNSSEAFAASLSEIPVIRNIVRVLTFKKYELSEDGFNADIKTPSIDGLENKELENALNEKYIN